MQRTQSNKSTSVFDAGLCFLPEGIKIQKVNTSSYVIKAAKDFVKGQIVLNLKQCMHVPKETDEIRMIINGQQYRCNKEHTIQYEDYRYFPGFCSFMNHACQANTIFTKNRVLLNNVGTQLEECFAVRDIKAGQQLNCNYLYFYYDGDDSEQFQCACGSQKCYKQIKGFKYLSLEDKISFLPILYSEVKQMWLKQDRKIKLIEDFQIPQGIILDRNTNQLRSQKVFKKDEVVFKYRPIQISSQETIIIKKGEIYEAINKEKLAQMPNNSLEYLQLFTSKSTSPNIKVFRQGKDVIGISITQIKAEEILTEAQSKISQKAESNDVFDVGSMKMPDGVIISRNTYGQIKQPFKEEQIKNAN